MLKEVKLLPTSVISCQMAAIGLRIPSIERKGSPKINYPPPVRDDNGYIPIGYDLPIPTLTIVKTPHHPYPSPTTGLKFPHTHHPSGSGYLAGDPYPLHYNCC
jgi:hypothetical protein